MNNIPQNQNKQQHLEQLAAFSQLYFQAKILQNIRIILSVPLTIIWSIVVATILPSLQVYAAIWAILVTFIDLIFLSPWQKSLQGKAAKIQQKFDCDILQLERSKLFSGALPQVGTITSSALKYRRRKNDYSELKNWYPVSSDQLPISEARIICQRSNIWWDADLRRRYSRWVAIVLTLIFFLIFIVSIINDVSMAEFVLTALSPLIPILVLGTRQYSENMEAANTLDIISQAAEDLWQKLIDTEIVVTELELETESYRLQDKIYDNRRFSPLIPSWFYSILKRDSEMEMNRNANAMVQELLNSRKDF